MSKYFIEDRSPDILYAKILEYPLAERLKVRHVSIDLSPAFKKMVEECFPNAKIAADKFHTVRMANDATRILFVKSYKILCQKSNVNISNGLNTYC